MITSSFGDLDITAPTVGTTQYSERVDISMQAGFAVYGSWSGTSIQGAIFLQASADGTNWVLLSGASEVISGHGEHLWNVSQVFFRFFRVGVTSSAGTIDVSLYYNAKGEQ